MTTLGRHQRAHFDATTVFEAIDYIAKFEAEIQSLGLASSPAAMHRRAELEARIEYLKVLRLAGRTYERFTSVGEVHAIDCPVARAISCTAEVACKHGKALCLECDICNCGGGRGG